MRPEENPLDLNNLPEEYSRDDTQDIDDNSFSAGKVYECRFCSLRFCKSQALGGHMNRHRQERETETLNRARQLVFGTDNLAPQTHYHIGGQPIQHGLYHQTANMGDPNLLRYPPPPPPRLFSGPSSTFLPQPPPPFLYSSPPHPSHGLIPYTSQYPSPSPPPPHDYLVGHVVSGNNSHYIPAPPSHADTNFTCIGAPIGHAFPTTRMPDMATSAMGRGNGFHDMF